jgi:hypothetical protein
MIEKADGRARRRKGGKMNEMEGTARAVCATQNLRRRALYVPRLGMLDLLIVHLRQTWYFQRLDSLIKDQHDSFCRAVDGWKTTNGPYI